MAVNMMMILSVFLAAGGIVLMAFMLWIASE